MPHFDRIERWVPGLLDGMLARTPPGAVLVGIDEETALVAAGGFFTVRGTRSAWRIDADGSRTPFGAGEHLDITGATSL